MEIWQCDKCKRISSSYEDAVKNKWGEDDDKPMEFMGHECKECCADESLIRNVLNI